MQEIVRRESIHFNTLDDVLKAARNDDRQDVVVYGLKKVGAALGEGITLLACPGRIAFYNAATKTLKVWLEKGILEP